MDISRLRLQQISSHLSSRSQCVNEMIDAKETRDTLLEEEQSVVADRYTSRGAQPRNTRLTSSIHMQSPLGQNAACGACGEDREDRCIPRGGLDPLWYDNTQCRLSECANS